MKYDDASWHYGGDYPKELPIEAGATHTGMFVAWALLSGLGGDVHLTELPAELEELRARAVTPGRFFMAACDGKFTDDDLNDEGNAFAQAYFDFDRGSYLHDYDQVLVGDLPTIYHVADTWDNFAKLRPLLDERFAAWRRNA